MTTVSAETITQQRQTLNLNLKALKTVTWLETNPVVDDVSQFSKRQCDKAREYSVIGWIFALIEFQLLWLYTLLHTIPWPSWVIAGVHRVDDAVEWALETAFRKLEWWWDYLSVHLMRAVETAIVYLDKLITFIDHAIEWLLHKYHWVWEASTKVLVVAVSVWDWYIGMWAAAWKYLSSFVHSVQSAWEGSQKAKQQ